MLNARGEYVPAIPQPYWERTKSLLLDLVLWRSGYVCVCECGEKRPNFISYSEHYAYAHVMGMI